MERVGVEAKAERATPSTRQIERVDAVGSACFTRRASAAAKDGR